MNPSDDRNLVPGVISALRDVADAVIVPRFRQLAKGDIRSKTSPGDLVTVADEESERALGKRLNALLPGSRVVGEEAAFADPTLFDLVQGSDQVWIIDPVDGTANFVNGIAAFAVIVALVHEGETIKGWIYEPLEGKTLWAEKGKGAWRAPRGETGGQRVLIPPAGDDLSKMVAALHHKDFARARRKFARNMWIGSAAHDYWALAEGRTQVLAYRRLKPWDHAAGLLIHEEAGGYGRLLTGERYNPLIRDQQGLLCAPTQALWDTVRALAPEQLPLFPGQK